jgi:hypothetical protein
MTLGDILSLPRTVSRYREIPGAPELGRVSPELGRVMGRVILVLLLVATSWQSCGMVEVSSAAAVVSMPTT